jgi:hypothetical protein
MGPDREEGQEQDDTGVTVTNDGTVQNEGSTEGQTHAQGAEGQEGGEETQGAEGATGDAGGDKPGKQVPEWVTRRFGQLTAEKHTERRERERLAAENEGLTRRIRELFGDGNQGECG